MLLPASNYSFLLYGMDIVYDLCLCAELNGWLWMPWLVYMPEETKLWLAPENEVGTEMAAGQQTLDLAEQRRESHRAFNVAVKEGKVTQGYLWGEQ